MPFSNPAMVIAATALRNSLGGIQLHIDNPGDGGAANKSDAPMKVPAWTNVTGDGDFGLAAPLLFTGCTPNGPIRWFSVWSNTTSGKVWYGNFQLTGDLSADSEGNYTIQTFPLNGAST